MKSRLFTLTALFVFFASVGKSQDYRYIYYLDESLVSVDKSKAVILAKGVKESGLLRLDCFDITGKKLLLSLHFTDSSLADLKGPYSSYHSNGRLEKQGDFLNGFEEGSWQSWDSLGRKTDSSVYKNGYQVMQAKFNYHLKSNVISKFSFTDSLQETYQSIYYTEQALKKSEVFFKGNSGLLKTYSDTSGGVQIDSVFTREEIDAQCVGGAMAWSSYLRRSLDATVPVNNKAPEGTYTVIVKFIITKDGSISDVQAETNHGFGMETEAIRIIKNGPKWVPAVQYGRIVKAFRRQPVTFAISDDRMR